MKFILHMLYNPSGWSPYPPTGESAYGEHEKFSKNPNDLYLSRNGIIKNKAPKPFSDFSQF